MIGSQYNKTTYINQSTQISWLGLSGREGREKRERVRRLWAGEVGGEDRYVFVVPEVETEEENKEIIEESKKFEDILQTDIKLSESHDDSKQVKLPC